MATKIKNFQIPNFSGFYNSIWNDNDESMLKELNEIDPTKEYELDWKHYQCDITVMYAKHMSYYLTDLFNNNLTFEDVVLSSPKEHNFKTDEIYSTLVISNNNKFRRTILKYMSDNKNEIADKIFKRFTSCSGYISFVSNDYNTWLNIIKEWDTTNSDLEIMLSQLISFIIDIEDENEGYGIELKIYEELSSNGYDISQYYCELK